MNRNKARWLLIGFSVLLLSIFAVAIIVAVSSMLYFKPDEDIIRLAQRCVRQCKSVTIRVYWGKELTDERKLVLTDDTKQNCVVTLFPPNPPGLIKTVNTKANYVFDFDCGEETIGFGYLKGLDHIWISYDFFVKKGGKLINVNPEFCKFLNSLIEQAELQVLPVRYRR